MKNFNYHGKVFRSVNNSAEGEVDAETVFHYRQQGNMVTATYEGGNILFGQLIALMDKEGRLNMRYQHLNQQQQLMTGRCISVPEVLPNGKIRMHESWQWTSGNGSSGKSVIEEV